MRKYGDISRSEPRRKKAERYDIPSISREYRRFFIIPLQRRNVKRGTRHHDI